MGEEIELVAKFHMVRVSPTMRSMRSSKKDAPSKRSSKTPKTRPKKEEKQQNEAREEKESKRSIEDDLICPIDLELPYEPVMAEDGRIYEKECIYRYFIRNPGNAVKSPVTSEWMGKKLVPSHQTRNHIETLIDNGIIQGDLAKKWKVKAKDNSWKEDALKKAKTTTDTALAYNLLTSKIDELMKQVGERTGADDESVTPHRYVFPTVDKKEDAVEKARHLRAFFSQDSAFSEDEKTVARKRHTPLPLEDDSPPKQETNLTENKSLLSTRNSSISYDESVDEESVDSSVDSESEDSSVDSESVDSTVDLESLLDVESVPPDEESMPSQPETVTNKTTDLDSVPTHIPDEESVPLGLLSFIFSEDSVPPERHLYLPSDGVSLVSYWI